MNSVYRMADIDKNLRAAGLRPLDVLVVGGTGAGKSSTLNTLFQREVAKVGNEGEPETMSVNSVRLNNLLRFWDTPGLGDNVYKDMEYAKELVNVLYRECTISDKQYGLIDTVLVILDGSGRDLGTTYKLLNEVIVPNIQTDRILIAINQADVAMKGRHWNETWDCPDNVLHEFLEQKAASVQSRIREATGVNVVKPVYYSAERNYNVEKLLDMIIDNIPRERRQLKM